LTDGQFVVGFENCRSPDSVGVLDAGDHHVTIGSPAARHRIATSIDDDDDVI
jgi:hypothetical protein